LRKIAERAGEALSWVQRNLAEMQSLEYFKRSRGRKSFVYWLADRFLPTRESRQQDSVRSRGNARDRSIDQQRDPHVESRQQDRRRIQENDSESKNTRGDLGRAAPSDEDKAYVTERVAEITAALTGRATPAPAAIADPGAYEAAVAKNRRDQWLCNLGAFASQFFSGRAREEAWQTLDIAQKAGSRAATPPPIRKMVDSLNTLYRDAVKHRRFERDQTNERIRNWSFEHSAKWDNVA
jgi:hypothetical protein